MSLVKGIHHVCLKCSGAELDSVISFYKDVLGMEIARTWDTGIMFDTGCGLIEVFTNGDELLPKGAIHHFALAVDDVDACVAAVTNAGYEVFDGPRDICIPSNPGFPARIAFCNGPLGEEIEFFQEK